MLWVKFRYVLEILNNQESRIYKQKATFKQPFINIQTIKETKIHTKYIVIETRFLLFCSKHLYFKNIILLQECYVKKYIYWYPPDLLISISLAFAFFWLYMVLYIGNYERLSNSEIAKVRCSKTYCVMIYQLKPYVQKFLSYFQTIQICNLNLYFKNVVLYILFSNHFDKII